MRFHVTEAGPPDGRPVLALHGWPQHHWEYRDLLADPPPGLRIIAPDLPGYGWSGPAPHKWAKDRRRQGRAGAARRARRSTVFCCSPMTGARTSATSWCSSEPERFDGYLACNMAHPWLSTRDGAAAPVALLTIRCRSPRSALRCSDARQYVERVIFGVGSKDGPRVARVFAERFRDPVCAQAGRDTYRTFLTREIPRAQGIPRLGGYRFRSVCLYGTGDFAVHPSFVAAETAKADDYTLSTRHFVVDAPGSGRAN